MDDDRRRDPDPVPVDPVPAAPVPAASLPVPVVPAQRRQRRRISVVWALVANFGGLLVVAMLAIFGLAFWSASENTIVLLRDRSEQTVQSLQRRMRDHLDEPGMQLRLMAEAISSGKISPDNERELEAYLTGGIAGMPQLRGLTYIGRELRVWSAQRIRGEISFVRSNLDGDPLLIAWVRETSASRTPGWIPPLYRPIIGQTVIGRAQPVIRNGQVIGVLVAVIGIEELSAYVARLGNEVQATAFILYGRDHVLAHSNLMVSGAKPTAKEPLQALAGFSDRILASLWDEKRMRGRLFVTRPPIENHTLDIGGTIHLVFFTALTDYSDRPLLVGAYVQASDFSDIANRLIMALIAGAAAIVAAIVLAVLLGRRLARPVRRFSAAAVLIGDLRVAEVQPLPKSRIREIDEQARAFNSMVQALRWFEAYVPRALARHLLKSGNTRAIESEQRNLTVMFTDIVGYSTWSQGQSAAAVAEYLNRHFGLVIGCIEQEGGVVDKFIGDSVMAFWGAPEKIKNRAERACRAALCIRTAIERDNEERVARGEKPTRMRIGIHSGDATVGNIGSAGRLNYTIIGDMVNAGQRIEQLAKTIGPLEATVAILISESTRADLGPEFSPVSLGHHALRGRDGMMEIYAI